VSATAETVETASLPSIGEDVWTARPWLSELRAYATARECHADAALGVVLARVAASIPPASTLDTGIGSPASANLFVAPVARPGLGKTTAPGVARDVWPTMAGGEVLPERPVGTGEGLTEAYLGRVRVPTGEEDARGRPTLELVKRQVRDRLLFILDEGDNLTQMAGRSGTTVMGALRSAWMGEAVGQTNATVETSRSLLPRSYAMGVVVNYQPGKIAALLGDTESGTAQRWLLVNADVDPTLPAEVGDDDQPTAPLLGQHHGGVFDHPGGQSEPVPAFTLDAGVRRELRQARRDERRGVAVPDRLDTHRNLLTVKVAMCLVHVEGRSHIDRADWQLAGRIVAASCALRDELVRQHREAAEDEEVRRLERDRARATAQAVGRADGDAVVPQVAARVVELVRDRGPLAVAGRDGLTQAFRSDRRPYVREAVALAVRHGRVTVDDGTGLVCATAEVDEVPS